LSTTNIPHKKSPLSHAEHIFKASSPGIFANAGQTRTFGPITDEGNKNPRRRHHSSSIFEVSQRDAPLHVRNSIWDMNEQQVPSKVIHAPYSVPRASYPGQAVQQRSEPLDVIDSRHAHPDSPGEQISPADVLVQQQPHNSNLQDEVSKDSSNEIGEHAREPAHFAGSQEAGLSDSLSNHYGVSMFGRVPSRAPSEAPSRPQSRRSNCGKPITRPIPAQDLRPQGILESIAQRPTHSMKVKKHIDASNNPIASEASIQPDIPVRERPNTYSTQCFFDDYKKFLATGQEYLEVLQGYERQSQLLESQKVEIQKLRDTGDTSIKQIQALESDKVHLTDKLKKFTDLSSKYKKHMNDVVKAQKYLKSQANEIQLTAKEAIKARDAREADLKKLESAIEDARSLQPAEVFAQGECHSYCYTHLLTSIEHRKKPKNSKL
jgi:hypothetical protein